MVENLKNTGTPFNYGKNDEWLFNRLPSVGLDNNPDKNQKFIDKDNKDIDWED